MEKLKKIIIYANIFFLLNTNFSYSAVKNNYPLIDAVRNNSITKTNALIEKYDVNLKDGYKNTALSYAVYNENFELIRILLRNGANPKIKDSSGNLIYCNGKLSRDYRIKELFKDYNNSKCDKIIAKKTEPANVSSDSFSINWKYVSGGLLGAGAIVAVAALSNNGSDDEDRGGGNRFSPADRNYGIVGQVNSATFDSILANDQYSGVWSVGGNDFSNKNSFNDIRLVYSLARGYTGKVIDTSGTVTPYYLTPGSTTTSLLINTKIKVAVLDSGVQTNHEDFGNGAAGSNISTDLQNTNLAYLYCNANPGVAGCTLESYTPNDPNPTTLIKDPTAWHGTFVTGLIGASYTNEIGITGVAPDSEIIPYRLTLNNGSFVPDFYIGEAFEYARQRGVSVINNSYGVPTKDELGNPLIDASDVFNQNFLKYLFRDSGSGSYDPNTVYVSNYIDKILNAVASDVIFVWAAGNDANSQPSIESAVPLFFNDFKSGDYYKNFIVAVAYDSDTKSIASYSNRCGIAKEYCLTAPGTAMVSLVSGVTTDGYGAASGTSFAAPLVSGAVAVLKGAFPYLTGAEITKILFITARDLGVPGVDAVYGWGMLDLERATRPVGATLVPVDSRVGTAGFGLTASTMQLSSSLASKIKSKNLNFVILDSFNRTFNMKLNDFIETDNYDVRTIDILKKFGENKPLSVAMNGDTSFNFYFAGEAENKPFSEVEFSYSADNIQENNYGFNIYYGNNPYNAFVNNKVDLYNNFSLSNSYNYNILNPYFRTDSDINFGFNNLVKLTDKATMNFGVLYSNYTMDYNEIYTNKKMRNENIGASFSMLTGLNYAFNNNISAKIETGFTNEFDTMFGSKMNGAFGIGQNNLTYMMSLQNDINMFSNKISLFSRANFGYTTVNNAENTLVKNVSGLLSNSFSVGLNYNFDSRNKAEKSNISLLLVQPVRIISGDMDIALPIGRDMDGNLYYSEHKIDLKDKSNINLQLAYNYNIKNDSSFSVGFIYQEDYAENEYIMLLKYKKAFSF